MKRFIVPLLCSIISFSLFDISVFFFYRAQKDLLFEKEKNEVVHVLSDMRGKLEYEINSTFFLINGMVAYVSTNPSLSHDDFTTFATSLLTTDPHIKNVTLAPDNIITYVYPVEGNEKALGLNLATHSQQKATVEEVVKYGKTVIAGPIELVQGGRAFINRTPIYIKNDRGESQYWGMASIPILMDSVFATVGVKEKVEGVKIAIRGKDGLGEKGEVFFGDPSLFKENLETLSVNLPDGSWQLGGMPENGWHSVNSFWIYLTGTVLALIFSILLGITLFGRFYFKELNSKMGEYIHLVDKYIITSSTDLDGIITETSEAFCNISGYDREELIGHNHNIIRHPDMPDELFKDLWDTITSGHEWRGEIKNLCKDGGFYWVDAGISPIYKKNRIIGYTAIRQDITNKKRIEEISIRDELTGLFNRRHFNTIFPLEIRRAKREERYFCFAILDIDHFKQYNDSYGHEAGDRVLESIGRVFSDSMMRASDYAFRLGGEEFGIVFSGLNKSEAIVFIERLRGKIENLAISHKLNSASPVITISAGLFWGAGQDLPSQLEIYRLADDKLYSAKKNGRNRVVAD